MIDFDLIFRMRHRSAAGTHGRPRVPIGRVLMLSAVVTVVSQALGLSPSELLSAVV